VRKIEENMGKKMLFDTHFGYLFKTTVEDLIEMHLNEPL